MHEQYMIWMHDNVTSPDSGLYRPVQLLDRAGEEALAISIAQCLVVL